MRRDDLDDDLDDLDDLTADEPGIGILSPTGPLASHPHVGAPG